MANAVIAEPAVGRSLIADHRSELMLSGLTDQTIEASGWYSESDPEKVKAILNRSSLPSGFCPCLVIPYRDHDGTISDYRRVKPTNPIEDGRKYESPYRKKNRAFFPPDTISELSESSPIVITEGEKKALSSDQAGIACIGLSGIWNWQNKREKDGNGQPANDRKLIDDLASVNWNRVVVICFDTDSRRNHNVNHARAELARILCDQGANVVLLDLPCGERGDNGEPGKNAIDDFIYSNGEDAFRKLVHEAISPSRNRETLTELRTRLASSRIESIGKPGVYVDLNPTGSGKSTAELAAITKAGSSLTVLPTHDLCKESEELYQDKDLNAAAYPKLSKDTCQNYAIATKAMSYGLPASQAVCPRCEFREDCDYRSQHEAAKVAMHRICTHKRAELSLATVSNGRPYIAIHENLLGILRPSLACSVGFENVAELARLAENDIPGDWPTPDETRLFFHQVASVAERCNELIATAKETVPIEYPGYTAPRDASLRLFEVIKENPELEPKSDPMRICMAVAAGSAKVVIAVSQQKEKTVRRAVAVWLTELPDDATCWLSDATGNAEEIRAVTSREITVLDSSGSLPRIHPLQQVPVDVSKSTSPERAGDILSQVVSNMPDAKKIGLITHRKFLQPTKPEFLQNHVDPSVWQKFAKLDWFRGTQSRGANSWKSECDAIIIFGTPRVPPQALEDHLIRTGNLAALGIGDPKWLGPGKWDYWSAKMPDGSRQTIKSTGYRNRDWHEAYKRETHSELLQAAGRARSNCEDGIPAIVVSNENLGLDIAGFIVAPLSKAERDLLSGIKELTDTSLYCNNSKVSDAGYSKVSVNAFAAKSLADRLGKTDRSVRRTLVNLEARGLVERVGQRSGWRLTSDATT